MSELVAYFAWPINLVRFGFYFWFRKLLYWILDAVFKNPYNSIFAYIYYYN
jgi:hypothetical protein